MTPAAAPQGAAMSPADYCPDRSLPGKIRRRLTQWQCTKPLGALAGSLITFSFDDFPKSAADTGADIMAGIDAPAIYYACSGLAGQTNLTGEQYTDADLAPLVRAGHEIGAHTHTHLDCARATPARVLEDIAFNLDQFRAMGLAAPVTHFAYPYGETTPALKRALAGLFTTCRGILPGQNTPRADRMQLRAMELTPDEATTARALSAIEAACHAPTWLHIFTHDVRARPSPFGTTPQALTRVARAARASGLPIITPSGAMPYLREAP